MADEMLIKEVPATNLFFVSDKWTADAVNPETGENYKEGDLVTVTVGDVEVIAELGKDAILAASAGFGDMKTAVTAAATKANNAGGTVYVVSGSFACVGGGASTNIPVIGGYSNVVTDAMFVKNPDVTGGSYNNGSAIFGPGSGTVASVESFLLSGSTVTSTAYVTGYASTTELAYLYVGEGAYAGTVVPAYSATHNHAVVDVAGGSVGTIAGSNVAMNDFDVILRDGGKVTTMYIGVSGGASFNGMNGNVNLTISGEGSSLSNFKMSNRSVGAAEWYKTFDVKLQTITVTVEDGGKLGNVGSADSNLGYWSALGYDLVLNGGTVTGTYAPGYLGALAVTGGTAVVTGGTYCTPSGNGITYGEEHVGETSYVDQETRYLMISGATKVQNPDGSFTVKKGVFYDTVKKEYIVGGDITYYNAVQNKFSVNVEGTQESYIKTLGDAVQTITIDATAQLTTGGSIGANVAITIDATDYVATSARKLVLKGGGAINATSISIVADGAPSTKYTLVKSTDDKNLYVVAPCAYFSSAWEGLADGTEVDVDGEKAIIGTNAFFLYTDAKAAAEREGWVVTSPDNFYNAGWSGKAAGSDVTVICPSGTIATKIGDANVKAYSSWSDAASAAGKTGTFVVAGGATSYDNTAAGGGRENFVHANSIFTNGTRVTYQKAPNGAGFNVMGGVSDASYSNTLTVNDGAYVQSIGVVSSGTSVFDTATINVDGGTVSTLLMVGYSGTAKGTVNVNMENSLVSTFTWGITGVSFSSANITVGDKARIALLDFGPTGAGANAMNLLDDSTITITMAGGTIGEMKKYGAGAFNKGANSAVNFVVTGASRVGTWSVASAVFDIIDMVTIKAQNGNLFVSTGFNNYTGTITIDVEGFTFGEGVDKRRLIHSSDVISNDIVWVGTPSSDYEVVWSSSHNELYLQKKFVCFSNDWADKTDGETVTVNGKDYTIGTDAFFSYADAKDVADKDEKAIQSPDNFFNYDWKNLAKGTVKEVICPSGTFSAAIGDADSSVKLYNNFDDAADATGKTGTLVITGGSNTVSTGGGNRKLWNYKHVIVTNAILACGGTSGINGAVLNIGAEGSSNIFTVEKGAYVHSIGAGHAASSGDLEIESSTIEVVNGGRVGVVYFGNAYAGNLTGTVDVTVKGGTVSKIQGTMNIGSTDDVNISITDGSYVDALHFGTSAQDATWTVSDNHRVTVTLSGSTIGGVESYGKVAKGENAGIDLVVTGAAVIGMDGAPNTPVGMKYFDTITINVGEYDCGLTFNGASNGYTGTYTVNLEDCEYTKAQYFILSSPGVTEDRIDLVGADESKGYQLVKNGNAFYYQMSPIYFSVLWTEKSVGDNVQFGDRVLTIGTDAFGKYSEVPEDKRPVASSADTYLNSNYTAESTIVLEGGYTTTYGTDAYSNAANAFSRAADGGKLFVTGGAFGSLEGMNGIENIDIADTKVTNSVAFQNNADMTIGELNIECENSEAGNGFVVISAGTVTGDVSVKITDSALGTTGSTSACYMVTRNGATIGGNLDVVITDSLLKRGLYVTDIATTGGLIKGNAAITLAGGTILRKGIVNDGTIEGTATVTVAADSIVSAIASNFDVVVNDGVKLVYGEKSVGEWKDEYFKALGNVENNGTIIVNTAIAQNAYFTVVEDNATLSGSGEITSEVGNKIFTSDDGMNLGTYVAAAQNDVYINAKWDGSDLFDTKTFDASAKGLLFGVSAFANIDDAKSMMAKDAVAHVTGNVADELIGNGKVVLSGSTVSGNVYAQGELTVSGSNAENSFSSLIGGGKGSAVVSESKVTIDTDKVIGKAIVGSSYLTTHVADIDSTSTVIVNGGSFSNSLIGGALVNGADASVEGTLNTNVTLAGGTVKALGGGCYLQGEGSAKIYGTSNVTINGGVVAGYVFGGSFANKIANATSASLEWNGDINVTIDTTTASVVIGGNLVAGNYGKGTVSGNTTLTFKGSGDDLSIGGHITGDCSGGDDSAEGKFVTGTRTLAFDGFSGEIGSNEGVKKITGFDAVAIKDGDVKIVSYGMLSSVSDWSITNGTLDWGKGANNFSGDKLSLISTTDIGEEGWTVFNFGNEGLMTNWTGFTLDDSGDSKINLTIGDNAGIAVWDADQEAYVATFEDAGYKFYKEDTALKVAKLA
ncbi:MAG: hypothetical protein MJ033_06110 [Victivallaceae bacterium]|nr:hypothetical protein [Victivallaceae bacterium]